MDRKIYLLLVFTCLLSFPAIAQKKVRDWLTQQADTLCSPAMSGRGYVNNGRLKAADYIEQQFRSFELQPSPGGSYIQAYNFSVNTFPDHVNLEINGSELTPGVDFLVDAGSASCVTKKIKIKEVELDGVKDKAG